MYFTDLTLIAVRGLVLTERFEALAPVFFLLR